ncbi:MAG TPA: response regulator [Candidatus Sulfotelmatobacter sp.]|jgi:CheY-like chemotaxis protein|nr:response regulator [Candidatus Sulfotelmatobacter sp.]
MTDPVNALSVLIVDDNEHVRKLVKVILRSIGVNRTAEAENGRQALNIMREAVPDIVLTDWEMEGMDGLQLTRHIRRSTHSPNVFLPVIVMTGQADMERVLAARDAGVNEFVIKPLSGSALLSRIRAILDTPRPFISGGDFFGPDRRRRTKPWDGEERRGKAPATQVASPSCNAMPEIAQQAVNTMMNQGR